MNSSKTILLIDDDKKFLFGLATLLHRHQYQVLSANNAQEALSILETETPDIIVCDLMMPMIDGMQFKKALAKNPSLEKVPFIFLTARASQSDKISGMQVGADDYITKPFNVDELLARIQAVLRRDQHGYEHGIQTILDTMDELKANISSNTNHEMRTPFSPVAMATLKMFLREKFTNNSGDLARYINLTSSSDFRLNFLDQDLQMLQEIDQGILPFEAKRIDFRLHLRNPVDQVLKMWRKKKLVVDLTIDPEIVIFAPGDKYGHVVAHLVDNACKFSPENGKISITLQPISTGGCSLEITNQGPQIPAELREKVFERFYQVTQASPGEAEGLGIGLTIARAFTRSWGGEIMILESPFGVRLRMEMPSTYGLYSKKSTGRSGPGHS
jgi:DNA-binding response OmpR family regulator